MKKNSKKLSVNRETVKSLKGEVLKGVNGGGLTPGCIGQGKCTAELSTCMPNSAYCYYITANGC